MPKHNPQPVMATPQSSLVQRKLRAPFQEFVRTGAIGGIVLLVCTAVALLWVNSPWGASYVRLWETPFAIGPTSRPLTLTLHHWINDGLMAAFFLLVGLEIKRELLVGELSTRHQAALPILAALGGMIVPAVLFAILNGRGAGSAGWGIPMATDIAFALGILRLVGSRIPVGLKVFLAAFAIVDDLGAVLVIALFYTASIDAQALLAAGAALAVLVGFNRARVTNLVPYVLVGSVLWYFLHESGVHATIAGVLVALTIPARTRCNAAEFSQRARDLIDEFDRAETGDLLVITSKGQQEALQALDTAASDVNAPLLRLEHGLHPIVAFLIMPLFAISNAGVRLAELGDAMTSPIVWGIVLGLCVGKITGITTFAWLAVRAGFASLPSGVTWGTLCGAALLGGIGFTMSLFIAGLAYPDPMLVDRAKAGILIASTVSGCLGFVALRRSSRRA